MQVIKVTDEMLDRAMDKAKDLGILKRSFMNGQGNLAGFIGEEVARIVLGGVDVNTDAISYEYDLLLDNGTRIDVKSKRTNVPPQGDYECSVNTYYKQDCDYYAFVRVHTNLQTAWFLGVYPRDQYYEDCVHYKKGDYDASNDFTFKEDAYNIKINDLKESIK